MKLISLIFIVFTFSSAQIDSIALDLANAERSFSALSEKEGIKNSFLAFFDDSCVMFNPHPVNGRELCENGPASTKYLTWSPVFVEVASSGNFGISTGPWQIRASKSDTVSANGYFFSVWEKRNNKEWKVTLDLGVSFPINEMKSENQHFKTLRKTSTKTLYPESEQLALEKVEKKFIQSYRKRGSLETYQSGSSENLRVYRDDKFPAVNKVESINLLKDDPQQENFIPLSTCIASSGDMGFTYGYAVTAQKDSSTYVRVWRKEKEWKMAVDILKPFKD